MLGNLVVAGTGATVLDLADGDVVLQDGKIDVDSPHTANPALLLQTPAAFTSDVTLLQSDTGPGTGWHFVRGVSGAVEQFAVNGQGDITARTLNLDMGLTLQSDDLTIDAGLVTVTSTSTTSPALTLDMPASFSGTALEVNVATAGTSSWNLLELNSASGTEFVVDGTGAVVMETATIANALTITTGGLALPDGVLTVEDDVDAPLLTLTNTAGAFTDTLLSTTVDVVASNAFHFYKTVADADGTPTTVFALRGDGHITQVGGLDVSGGSFDFDIPDVASPHNHFVITNAEGETPTLDVTGTHTALASGVSVLDLSTATAASHINNFRLITATAGGVDEFVVHKNGDIEGSRLTMVSEEDADLWQFSSTHATLTGTVMRLDAARAENSGFMLLEGYANAVKQFSVDGRGVVEAQTVVLTQTEASSHGVTLDVTQASFTGNLLDLEASAEVAGDPWSIVDVRVKDAASAPGTTASLFHIDSWGVIERLRYNTEWNRDWGGHSGTCGDTTLVAEHTGQVFVMHGDDHGTTTAACTYSISAGLPTGATFSFVNAGYWDTTDSVRKPYTLKVQPPTGGKIIGQTLGLSNAGDDGDLVPGSGTKEICWGNHEILASAGNNKIGSVRDATGVPTTNGARAGDRLTLVHWGGNEYIITQSTGCWKATS
jgi:hypothetical protein